MKKVIKSGILLTIIIFFVTITVNAEDPADKNKFSHDGFEYTVTGIHLDVYESKLEDNNFVGYKKETLHQIPLENFTITPTYTDYEDNDEEDEEDSLIEEKNTIINLGLNTTQEEMLELVKQQYSTVDDAHHYYIRVVVDFMMTKVPNQYKYYYQTKYVDTNNNIIASSENPENNSMKTVPFELNTEISEVFNCFEYKLDKDGEVIFNYSNHYTKGNEMYIDFLLNDTVYSSLDETKQQIILAEGANNNNDDPDVQVATEKYYKTINFVGYDNYEEYIEEMFSGFADSFKEAFEKALDEMVEENSTEIEKIPTNANNQTVNVGDTAATYPLYIYVLSVIGILVGVLVIASVRVQNKQQKQIQQ